MNRRVVADMLDVAGAAMTEAESAEIGLKLIDERDFDMALVDLRMPGMDGITAIRRIRERPDAKAKLPIIVVTADTAIDLRERCIAAGANEVLFSSARSTHRCDAWVSSRWISGRSIVRICLRILRSWRLRSRR